MAKAITYPELQTQLEGFYGTENYYRPSILSKNLLVTDGAKAWADLVGGYWFFDSLILHKLFYLHVSQESGGLNVVILDVLDDRNWDIYLLRDFDSSKDLSKNMDKYGIICIHEKDKYTDCPIGMHRFYLQNSVLFLPSEY